MELLKASGEENGEEDFEIPVIFLAALPPKFYSMHLQYCQLHRLYCSLLTSFFSLPLRFTSEKSSKSIQMVSSHPVKIFQLFVHNHFNLFTSKNVFK